MLSTPTSWRLRTPNVSVMNVKWTLRSTYSLGRSSIVKSLDRVEALVVVVDLLLEVRHPSAVDLGDHDRELGEAVEDAGEDHLDDAVRRVEEAPVARAAANGAPTASPA